MSPLIRIRLRPSTFASGFRPASIRRALGVKKFTARHEYFLRKKQITNLTYEGEKRLSRIRFAASHA
ncbi:MAG: hypothetical protein HY613_00075 [Candidatus Rokubacteria bacterium]|nr:hypothetical protein [Candidatus Rokubacteria bacterium]